MPRQYNLGEVDITSSSPQIKSISKIQCIKTNGLNFIRSDGVFSWVLGWLLGNEFFDDVLAPGKFFLALLVFHCIFVAWWKFCRCFVVPPEALWRWLSVVLGFPWI